MCFAPNVNTIMLGLPRFECLVLVATHFLSQAIMFKSVQRNESLRIT